MGKFGNKGVSMPNKEKYTYRHNKCPSILLPYVRTYPLNSVLKFSEQFCHLLPNDLDHYAVRGKSKTYLRLIILSHNLVV